MRPWLLSKNSSTEARPIALRSPAPLKMTSCIDSPRSAEAFDSPSTQRTASMTLDLPQPLGPTMPTSCPGVAIDVGSTKDLNPESLICVRRKGILRRDASQANACFGQQDRRGKKLADYSGGRASAATSTGRFVTSGDRLDMIDHGGPFRADSIVEF